MRLRETEIAEKLAGFLKPGWTVLDIGAGKGLVSLRLKEMAKISPTLTDIKKYNQTDLPWLEMESITKIPVPDNSFDAVIILFVLHHIKNRSDQEAMIKEALRIAKCRVIIAEDTAGSSIERITNSIWDLLLNLPFGIPTPLTFRSKEEWLKVLDGYKVDTITYRPVWPVMKTYTHTIFSVEKNALHS
ncbi:MAG TPA: class I SAM-dependent methyltransferase [Verrucomicrobiae bacterium]|nr:class I SAM-dependent methyltransferase [Verrucomicrobiae bacterium]